MRHAAAVWAGLAACAAGVVFHLQGAGVVGPESSFMHSSPRWTTYGMLLAAAGAGAFGAGIAARARRR